MTECLEDSLLIKSLKRTYTHLQLRCRHKNKMERKVSFFEKLKDKANSMRKKTVIRCRACKVEMYSVDFVDDRYAPAVKRLKRRSYSKSWEYKDSK